MPSIVSRAMRVVSMAVGLTSPFAVGQAPLRQPTVPSSFLLLQQRIADIAAPYVDPAGAPGKAIGLVVGVSSHGVRLIQGFGAKVRYGAVPPGADDIFEIGSVTKVFTGYLLARATQLGQVALVAPIDPYFPAGSPHSNGQSITLLDLATHTSGLPNFPNNLHSSDPANPGAGYTAQDLENFMAGYALGVVPGTQFLYSNLGAGTLGHVLVQSSGALGFEALVRQQIADPLSMHDTRIALSPEQQARQIQGYNSGQPAPFNVIGEPLAGGGALRSTARDLLAFFEPAVGFGSPDAVASWPTCLVAWRPSPLGINASTGLMVNIEDHAGGRLYSKSGGTAGFTSQIAFMKAPRATVVLLTNCRNVQGLHDLAAALVDLLREP